MMFKLKSDRLSVIRCSLGPHGWDIYVGNSEVAFLAKKKILKFLLVVP